MLWAVPFESEMLEALLKIAAISGSTSINLSALLATRSFLQRIWAFTHSSKWPPVRVERMFTTHYFGSRARSLVSEGK